MGYSQRARRLRSPGGRAQVRACIVKVPQPARSMIGGHLRASLKSRGEPMRSDRTAMASTLGRPRASVLHRCIRAAALFGALAFSSPLLAESPVDSRAYKLAPGDRIIVTVFGQDELSAESLLDGAGTIVLPVIGPLEVKDLTILECQKLIYDQLRS